MELTPSDAPLDTTHGSIYFIGTATVLIRYAGFTVLTDPNFPFTPLAEQILDVGLMPSSQRRGGITQFNVSPQERIIP